jgi:hypothetical protein
MKSNVSRITSGAFAVGMLVGVSACVQLFDPSPDVKVRPVANMQDGKASPDSEYYLSAVSAINGRDYATALEYLQAARAKEPENIRVLNAFGVVYDKLGRFDLSARYYAQASALDPKSIIVAKNLAYSKALQGISAPDVSQVASAETPSTAPQRVADAQVAPVWRVLPSAASAMPPLPAPTAVTAVAQSSASDVLARPSPTTVAMLSPKPAATLAPASLSSPQPVAPNVAPFVRAASPAAPTPALPAHVLVTPAGINKTAAASMKADVSELPISPAASSVTVIAKSSAPGLPVQRPATAVAMVPPKPAASIVPASLSSPRLAAPVAAMTAKTVAPDISASVRPAHSPLIPAVTIKPAVSVKANVPETPISPAAFRIAKSPMSNLPARSSAPTVAMVPPKSGASIAPASLSVPRSAPPVVAASISKMAAPTSPTSARPAHPSATATVAIKAVASPKTDASKTVLLTGYPLIVTDASGAMDIVQSVRHNLAMLGWTISRAATPNVHSQHDSILFYPPVNIAAAHALARTLPFPVRMTVNQCHCGGLQLVIGSEVPSWKNVHRYNPSLHPKTLAVAAIPNTTRMGVQ